MKRKQIEKIAPVQPKKTGEYITTVQMVGELLVLNVFKNGILKGRQAINPETGEYAQHREDGWEFWKYARLLDIDTDLGGWYGSKDKQKAVFDTKEQEELVQEKLKKIAWHTNTFDIINDAERKYGRDKKEKTEENRIRRVQDKMALVPELPEDAYNWIWQQEGEEEFVFYNKDKKSWSCSSCKKTYSEKYLKREDGEKKVRHNDFVICPRCKTRAMAKKRVTEVVKKTHFCLMQALPNGMSAIRYFDVKMQWSEKGRDIKINESVRLIAYKAVTFHKYCLEIFYNQYGTGGVYAGKNSWDYEYASFDNKGNPANRRAYEGYLYPKGIQEALEGTAYQGWSRIFQQMAEASMKIEYNNLLSVQNNTKIIGVAEYLFKGRFYKLLKETAKKIYLWSATYHGVLNAKGRTIEEIFLIEDRQLINRIRDVDGGEKMVLWMRWSEKEGKKLTQDTIEWLSRNNIGQEDVAFIKDKMSPQQIMHYVERQKKEGYRSKKAREIISQWEDYLQMLKQLGKKTDDEMMFRPRELKRRHDECVEEIRRQRMLAEMKRDRKKRYEEARRMREKFPGAEEILKEIKEKYEYAGEEYMIIVPQKLVDIMTEGQALHHCAGATDRYFDRILQRETYICFLRKTSEPKIPFYTIEVEPGGTIRQHRGMYDEEPGIKEIKPFLREWQKEIKKRLTKKDKEFAKTSAVKRQENIEELKAKNNTKVLQGLMEDFMEAM